MSVYYLFESTSNVRKGRLFRGLWLSPSSTSAQFWYPWERRLEGFTYRFDPVDFYVDDLHNYCRNVLGWQSI